MRRLAYPDVPLAKALSTDAADRLPVTPVRPAPVSFQGLRSVACYLMKTFRPEIASTDIGMSVIDISPSIDIYVAITSPNPAPIPSPKDGPILLPTPNRTDHARYGPKRKVNGWSISGPPPISID